MKDFIEEHKRLYGRFEIALKEFNSSMDEMYNLARRVSIEAKKHGFRAIIPHSVIALWDELKFEPLNEENEP